MATLDTAFPYLLILAIVGYWVLRGLGKLLEQVLGRQKMQREEEDGEHK